jgi:hypothetical protein
MHFVSVTAAFSNDESRGWIDSIVESYSKFPGSNPVRELDIKNDNFKIFLNTSRKMSGYYLKLGHKLYFVYPR